MTVDFGSHGQIYYPQESGNTEIMCGM